MWNNPNDPMPIKTTNMAGLQKWEETDDYIIYLDKDAVMTTVENYVTGTYDLFLDRKADVDGAMELLKINNIEWTSEDDSKLILDINKAQLERIANTPATMEEEDFAPRTFTTRAVPTTYECCFRVDKSSGEIYIGEGYENLFDGDFNLPSNFTLVDGKFVVTTDPFDNDKWVNFIDFPYTAKAGETGLCLHEYHELEVSDKLKPRFKNFNQFGGTAGYISNFVSLKKEFNYDFNNLKIESLKKFDCIKDISSPTNNLITNIPWNIKEDPQVPDITSGDYWFKVKKYFICKTSTPKPFVKSVMPSGKLAFVTNATSETHSFIMKEAIARVPYETFHYYTCSTTPTVGAERICQELLNYKEEKINILVSKTYIYDTFSKITARKLDTGKTQNILSISFLSSYGSYKNLSQLLIYKGNLTEAELKGELAKDIKLR